MSFSRPELIGWRDPAITSPLKGGLPVESAGRPRASAIPSLPDAGEDQDPSCPSTPPSDAGVMTDAAVAIDASLLPRMSSKELCQKRRIFHGPASCLA